MRIHLTPLLSVLIGIASFFPVNGQDKFTALPYGSLSIGGEVGEKIDLCIENRVMAQDIGRLILPFQLRNDENWGFRCEFWGNGLHRPCSDMDINLCRHIGRLSTTR